MKRHAIPFAALALLVAGGVQAASKPYCGKLENGDHGPYDYRVAGADKLNVVEQFHFTEQVEAGVAGTSSYLGSDLNYVLRIFPNHSRALNTLIRVAPRAKGGRLQGASYPIECYFERAVRFQPDDGSAWGLYARYLYVVGQEARAFPMLEQAVKLEPDSPAINYNYGLALAKKKEYAAALPYAQKAYARAFPLPGLKQMLKAAGHWQEPPPAPAPAAPAEEAEQAEPAKPAAAAPPKEA